MTIMFLLFVIVGDSCKTSKVVVDTNDLSYLYNPSKSRINPMFTVSVQSSELSLLGVKFFADDLLFSEANPDGVPAAQMLINVKLYDETSGRVLSDTINYEFAIKKEGEKTEYTYNIPLRTKMGAKYMVDIRTLDRLRRYTHHEYLSFNTQSLFSRYNFRLQGYVGNNQMFTPIARGNELFRLTYLPGAVDTVFISYYKPFKVIPDPPSMLLPQKVIDYEPDTIIKSPYNNSLMAMFPDEGIFHCRVDSITKEGYTIFNFGGGFPKMTTAQEMIEPLTYLASQEELRTMRSASNQKIALDNFWISCTGNIERARELIRIYYSRVEYANRYFSSFTEGWRTERGMIYVIYGPPDKVYKTSDGENWGYRKPEVKSTWGNRYKMEESYIFFNFKKRETPFSTNDFFLSRNESLVTNWDQAILNWRKGIVYRFDNPEDI